MKTVKLTQRPGSDNWYLRRAVPKKYRDVESRRHVWLSTGTDSPRLAQTIAAQLWLDQLRNWDNLLNASGRDAEKRATAARQIVRDLGLAYLATKEVAELPTDELIKRLDAVPAPTTPQAATTGAAIMGAIVAPKITVSRALELYWDLSKADMLGKSELQLRNWRNPVIQATRDFIKAVEDKPISAITRADMRQFRDWWIDRIEAEGLNPRTANKNMDHFGKVLKRVNLEMGLDLTLPLGNGLRLKEGEKVVKPPFSTEWIKSKILAPHALDGLPDEARGLLLMMVNTGARPSELAALQPHRIHLDTAHPFIEIRADGRILKTRDSKRDIPLCGVSLAAARAFPNGFPRYHGSLTPVDDINPYLRTNGLKENDEQSLYSLRHAFEDRMLAAGIDERIRRDLMGHRLTRERYGQGATMERLDALITPLAL